MLLNYVHSFFRLAYFKPFLLHSTWWCFNFKTMLVWWNLQKVYPYNLISHVWWQCHSRLHQQKEPLCCFARERFTGGSNIKINIVVVIQIEYCLPTTAHCYQANFCDSNNDCSYNNSQGPEGVRKRKNTHLFCWCQIFTNCPRIPKM